jgi:hypothetical protein
VKAAERFDRSVNMPKFLRKALRLWAAPQA